MLKELVSQGRDHTSAEAPPVSSVARDLGGESQPERKKRKVTKPYAEFFIRRYDVKNRSCVYIDERLKIKLDKIVNLLSLDGMPLANYLDNIIEHHLWLYEDEINDRYRSLYNPDKIL